MGYATILASNLKNFLERSNLKVFPVKLFDVKEVTITDMFLYGTALISLIIAFIFDLNKNVFLAINLWWKCLLICFFIVYIFCVLYNKSFYIKTSFDTSLVMLLMIYIALIVGDPELESIYGKTSNRINEIKNLIHVNGEFNEEEFVPVE